jgi:Polyketide cyclase / dehydrase and lipid transport
MRIQRVLPPVRGKNGGVGVQVSPEIVVRRERADVAAYMFDPAHDVEWTGGITASRPAQPGPLVEGAAVERDARFLGRRFSYRYVVTAHEPDRMVELKVDRPFPMTIRYELADHPDGTLVAIHAVGEPGRFFGWARPLMARRVRASITADLDRLRDRLEHPLR